MPRILGCDVFETEAFDVDFCARPVNQLNRDRQCGEYLDLGPIDGGNKAWQIYSADSDQFETVNVRENDLILKGQRQMPILFVDAGRAVSYDRRAQEEIDRLSEDQKPNYHRVLLRPHATWRMSSCIILKKGEELGCTFHGNHSFVLQSDNVRKIHMGHYTYYSKSVVTDDRKLMIMEDVYCTGYVGGEGHKFYERMETGEKSYRKHSREPIDHDTPSLIYAVIHKDFLTETHMNIQSFLGVNEETPDDSIFLQEYLHNNYDCFQGCVKEREVNNADASKMKFRCVKQPRGHWLSVYDGVRQHRIGRSNAFIKEP